MNEISLIDHPDRATVLQNNYASCGLDLYSLELHSICFFENKENVCEINKNGTIVNSSGIDFSKYEN